MTIAPFAGAAVGLAAGISLGIVGERMTRVDAAPAVAKRDEWERRYYAEFGPEEERDTIENAKVGSRLEAFLRDDPPPEGVTADRNGASWSYTEGGHGSRAGWAALAAGVGAAVFIVGTSIAFGRARPNPDMARFTGLGGAALIAVPAAALGFAPTTITSGVLWDGTE